MAPSHLFTPKYNTSVITSVMLSFSQNFEESVVLVDYIFEESAVFAKDNIEESSMTDI